MLVVSSNDGTVAILKFEPGELGDRVPSEQFDQMITKRYGDILAAPSSLSLAETPYQLEVEKKMALASQNVPVVSQVPMNRILSTSKQLETRLPDGRRRITPQYISG